MCSKCFIYIIWFILTFHDIKKGRHQVIPIFQLKNVGEGNRVICLWLHSMSESGVAEYVRFAHCQSTLLSISPYSPYSLRCRPLGNWYCWGKKHLLKLDAFYKFMCFDIILTSISLPTFLWEWYKGEKNTLTEMKWK